MQIREGEGEGEGERLSACEVHGSTGLHGSMHLSIERCKKYAGLSHQERFDDKSLLMVATRK